MVEANVLYQHAFLTTLQVAGGCGTGRTLWLWTSYRAAEAAAATLERTGGMSGGGPHEAAVYAALCGHVARVLPVCTTWEDAAWAYFRAWLDLSVAMQLEADIDGDQVPLDAVMAALQGVDGVQVQEGMAAAAGAWPLPRCEQHGDGCVQRMCCFEAGERCFGRWVAFFDKLLSMCCTAA